MSVNTWLCSSDGYRGSNNVIFSSLAYGVDLSSLRSLEVTPIKQFSIEQQVADMNFKVESDQIISAFLFFQ